MEPTILNCSHTFCLSCIRQWKATNDIDLKTNELCPICRDKITTESRNAVVSNVIEKIIETLSLYEQKQRRHLIEERRKNLIKLINSSKTVENRAVTRAQNSDAELLSILLVSGSSLSPTVIRRAVISNGTNSERTITATPVSRTSVSRTSASRTPVSRTPVSRASVSRTSVSRASVSRTSVSIIPHSNPANSTPVNSHQSNSGPRRSFRTILDPASSRRANLRQRNSVPTASTYNLRPINLNSSSANSRQSNSVPSDSRTCLRYNLRPIRVRRN